MINQTQITAFFRMLLKGFYMKLKIKRNYKMAANIYEGCTNCRLL